ncbi:interferon-induced protein 44-like isoform X2 [Paramormyrops kingsleyae]|uniref:interferon-induced protein 44-like isoform X2 n=1 Tax=Paramormyrops kingsleyae TaxID=1676925 RepID=UPI003B96D104
MSGTSHQTQIMKLDCVGLHNRTELRKGLEVRKMGGSSSTERVETEVKEDRNPELLNKPWRNVVWDHSTRTNLKKYLQDYKPTVDSVPKARILLVGATGAGKSSFFNSINSVCRGNMTSQAKAGSDATCMTMQYRTYTVRAGRGGQPLAFLLCDTMGLQISFNGGVRINDIESILKGYIPDKYQFNPLQAMDTTGCQTGSRLPLQDRIHCVVCVIDATRFLNISGEMKNKFHEIQKRTNFHDVPLLVLLTQVDNACPHVERDLRNVYRSCFIKELITRASEYLSVPVLNVLPVKNYCHEIELNDSCDILLLSAMKQMLNFADNYLDSCEENTE